jgi:hypothetical protein
VCMKERTQNSSRITYVAPKVHYCPACRFVVVREEPTFPLHPECAKVKTSAP